MRSEESGAGSLSASRHTQFMVFTTACLGGVAYLGFTNGFLLAYFSRLNLSEGLILGLLAAPAIVQFLLVVPFGYLSDWFGKKLLGTIGIVGMTSALGILAAPELFSEVSLTVSVGVVLFSAGSALVQSNWFALLDPLIRERERGRFFGSLRLTWQTFGFFFALGVSYLLERFSEIETYRWILGGIALLGLLRLFSYWGIPELEHSHPPSASLRKTFFEVLALPGYLPFCAYCFLLMLFTGACPQLFSLLERQVLGFSDDQLVLVGNLLTVGALVGFVLGGRAVDRFGTRYVFLLCHLLFGVILVLFLFREQVPFPLMVFLGMLTLLFGFAQAASGIAMTSEILSLIPKENKSLATGIWLTLHSGGAGLSGLLCGQVLEVGLLSSEWGFSGMRLSAYDSLILICGVMTLLMTVTLGLIPSMIRRAQWIPQGT
jgi:MFS family permease